MLVAGLCIVAGIALAGVGLLGAHRLAGCLGLLAACGVPIGVALALAGSLLLYLPDFFRT